MTLANLLAFTTGIGLCAAALGTNRAGLGPMLHAPSLLLIVVLLLAGLVASFGLGGLRRALAALGQRAEGLEAARSASACCEPPRA